MMTVDEHAEILALAVDTINETHRSEVQRLTAELDLLGSANETLRSAIAPPDDPMAMSVNRILDGWITDVQRLTAEKEALRELLQAFAISPEGVILRPEQADLYRSMADLYRPVVAETGETP
jgi:hypothetical protein